MVNVLRIDLRSLDLSLIKEAADVIVNGGLIIYPTDTVYGLGADPFNLNALSRVIAVKRRGKKPMPILVSSIEAAKRLVYVNDLALSLMEAFWPGPLTIVLPKRVHVPDLVTANIPSLGVRMPNHSVALKLIEFCGGQILGTSANISGYPPPKTASEAISQIGDKVDLVIDAGICPIGVSSTVVSLVDGFRIIREGAIKRDLLIDFIKKKRSF